MGTLCSRLDSWARPLRSLGSPSRYFPTAPKSTYYKVRLMSTDRIEWQACTAGYPNETAPMGSTRVIPSGGWLARSVPRRASTGGSGLSAFWQVLSMRSGAGCTSLEGFAGIDELFNFGVEHCVSTAGYILKTDHL